MARVYKDIERIYRHLEEIGFTIKNHTGDPYDDGQPMKVITSQPRQDANRKYVLETLLPDNLLERPHHPAWRNRNCHSCKPSAINLPPERKYEQNDH